MLDSTLLKLVPALQRQTPLGTTQHEDHEQIAISSCIAAIEGNLPCSITTSTPDYTCLCEQYLWRILCYDHHALDPSLHADRASTEMDMDGFCRAAGGIGADHVRTEHQRQKRQFTDLLSNIAGDVSSALAGNPLQLPARPSSTTAAAPSSTASSSMSEGTIGKATSSPAADSDSGGASGGLIVGVVIVALSVLALVGTFVSLFLQQRKKKKRENTPLAEKGSDPGLASFFGKDTNPSNGADQNVTKQQDMHPRDSTILTSTESSRNNMIPRKSLSRFAGIQATNKDVVEIGGNEIASPKELDAGQSSELHLGDEKKKEQGRENVAKTSPVKSDGRTGEFVGNRPLSQVS